ncbi:MAG: hypothetical protein U0K93_02210 [Acutalibacteraceae bacterium]|nr:hypothetical protein [Acutalibacteraceae bacterium]
MKNFKKIIALALAALMLLSFAGCHKKDEVAVTIGDVEFTSAYYMCALINADSEAKSKVYENLTEEEQQSGDIDYYSKKIDKKGFVEWVEDTAIDNLKTIAAYKTLCKENKIEVKEEDLSNAKMYASYYWSSYGYAAYFEPNGVSQDTYTKYMEDSYYSEAYFEHLYGAEGEKAVAGDEVKTKMYENFVIANILTANYTSDMKDADKTALKDKFNAYATALQNGSRTFKDVYDEYNNVTEEEKDAATTEEESDTPKPKDEYASIIGAEDTGYDAEYYEAVKAMATGEVKVIELEEGAGLVLAVKQDIAADEYYLTTLDMAVRHLIKDDEFEKTVKTYAKDMKVDINKFAVKQFKVKKIIEPSYN